MATETTITAERLQDLAERPAFDAGVLSTTYLIDELDRIAGVFAKGHRNREVLLELRRRLG
jgi:hypothetical protein